MAYSYRRLILSWILKILVTPGWVRGHIDAQCEIGDDGGYRFGPNCSFSCHCLNPAEQCDWKTGDCVSGCDWAWAGQGCQYKNIAFEKLSRHLDNLPQKYYSERANDNDMDTCSETDDENANVDVHSQRKVNPWWKIWFPQDEMFRQLTIQTSKEKKDFFRTFKVTVEFVPEEQNTNKNFYPEDQQLCYEQRDRAVESITISVTCEKPLVGNQLRITLGSINTQLVICDLRIFGCPIGFYGEQCKQQCSAYCLNQKCNHVDGNCTDGCKDGWKIPKCQECATGFYGEQCNQRCNVNCLNQNCDHVDGKCTDGCKDGWTSPHCNQACTAGTYGEQCKHQCSPNCRYGDKSCYPVDGKCKGGCKDGWDNPQCNQNCAPGFYGRECRQPCNSKCLNLKCDHVDGNCTGGCADGYTNQHCDHVCPTGSYGAQCKHQCSPNCLYGDKSCNHVDGKCNGGCKDGWKNPQCSEECATGFYGEQCNQRCNVNCLNQNCDHVDGKCTDGCKDGWTSPHCNQACTAGSYGEQCKHQCSPNCRYGDKSCYPVDGKCKGGCKDGWDNPQCNQKCAQGFYGRDCRQPCHVKCLSRKCNHVNGNCTDGCVDGWTNQYCDQVCPAGSYGAHCKYQCSINCWYGDQRCNHVDGRCDGGCKDGWTNSQCSDECAPGFYGQLCKQPCNVKCLNQKCHHVNGNCIDGCIDGWTNPICNQVCPAGSYGAQCKHQCSPNCWYGDQKCNHVDGTCDDGCKDGWTGLQCREECAPGFYGRHCRQSCNAKCLNRNCNHVNGNCIDGCIDGWTNPICDRVCPAGSYGAQCKHQCSPNCWYGDQKCNHVDGTCDDGCIDGWTGLQCREVCPDEYFGMNCTQKCSEHCIDVCNNVDGTCAQCELGWKGVNCTTECGDGSYGENCSNPCGHCKYGSTCHKTNGTCTLGCTEGFLGHDCMEALKLSETGPDTGPVQGLIVGSVMLLVIAALIVVVLLLRRRRNRKQKNGNSNVDKVASTEDESAESQGFNTYSNAAMVEDNRKVSDKVNAKKLKNGKGIQMEMMQAKDKLKQGNLKAKEDDNSEVYYNTGPMTKQRSQSAIRISDFGAYVKSGLSNKDFFFNEFQKIPYGSVHSTQIAKKPGNAKKNRYKDMYAYDHSRVILNKLPGDPDSDYINASFIRGNKAERAYIAAQGPTDFNVNDFWRMVLEKDVHTIVMVTNLVEETKMKCIQYWTEVEDTKTYGPISVYTEREYVFAEYTVRKFTVTQTDKPEKSHKVTHYNYNAWPDKDVPKSTSSLLHFWRRVRQNEKTRPWLVHCSAGVGRTGTFVAIDVLYDQGKDLGFLDVYQCVRDLRDQRVNMVQTKEQYKYLHSILTDIFVLPSQPIKMEELSVVYRDLKEIDRTNGKMKLLLEYETLRDEASNTLQEEESSADPASTPKAEKIYSCAKLSENKRKNRYENILASNEYRPFLSTEVKGCTNYINAVYISSYCDPHGFILTQTPMKHTVVDLYRLILEQEVKVVVTFEDHTKEEVGKCFPEDGSLTSGPFTMTFVSESCDQNFNTRIHTLKYQKEEQKVLQVVFKHWQTEVPVPPDPYKMYSFLQDIEKLQKQHEQKPIILSCLNGAERSGLIAVLINILERARFDGEVSIPQVIRQLRVRRQQIIPNFDQYKFCYDVFLCHAETNATYANM